MRVSILICNQLNASTDHYSRAIDKAHHIISCVPGMAPTGLSESSYTTEMLKGSASKAAASRQADLLVAGDIEAT